MPNGKIIGHVHYTAQHDDKGTLQELKTRASLYSLGLELYHHTLHSNEFWKANEIKRLSGRADELG